MSKKPMIRMAAAGCLAAITLMEFDSSGKCTAGC